MMKSKKLINTLPLLLCIFTIWCICFKGFISQSLVLTGDAVSYYNHTKFLTDSLGHGEIPLWDPVWNRGIPNDFFLKRLGSPNPMYLIIVGLNKIGIPHYFAYMIFLLSYFFIGLFGFYLLIINLTKQKPAAFCGFTLLLFSSLSFKLFESYLILIFTPTIWFFLSLYHFSKNPQKSSFFGLVFSSMILFSTYIPFYFLTILLTFLLAYSITHFQTIPAICKKYIKFILAHKIIFTLGCLAIIISLIPGILFMSSGAKSNLALPARNINASHSNTFAVAKQTLSAGGIILPYLLKQQLADFKNINLERFYIPLWGFILLLIAPIIPLNRNMLLLSLWGFFLFIICLNNATPIYSFLYQNIFFFKYFRNAFFFLWIAILPICIMFMAEIFTHLNKTRYKILSFPIIYITIIHIVFFIYTITLDQTPISIPITIILSLIFFLVWNTKKINIRYPYLYTTLIFLVILQPLHIFQYLKNNAYPHTGLHRYENSYRKLSYTHTLNMPKKFYVALKTYQNFVSLYEYEQLKNHFQHKFVIYDNVKITPSSTRSFKSIASQLKNHTNTAYVHSDDIWLNKNIIGAPSQGYIPTKDTPQFQLTKFSANTLKCKTNFKREKFLVYTDNYDKNWRAFINKEETPIFKTNVTYKGVRIPPGENTISFRYGTYKQHFGNLFLHLLYLGIFIYFILSFKKEPWENSSL